MPCQPRRVEIRGFVDAQSRSRFARWFNRLDARAAAKVTAALVRMEQANFSNVKQIGAGVSEYRIDFGPGYRIYFGMDGPTRIILLCGGTKSRQQQDVESAMNLWREYRRRKRKES